MAAQLHQLLQSMLTVQWARSRQQHDSRTAPPAAASSSSRSLSAHGQACPWPGPDLPAQLTSMGAKLCCTSSMLQDKTVYDAVSRQVVVLTHAAVSQVPVTCLGHLELPAKARQPAQPSAFACCACQPGKHGKHSKHTAAQCMLVVSLEQTCSSLATAASPSS